MGDPKKCGIAMLIVGVLILLNQYAVHLDWWTFVGIIFILKGICFMTTCQSSCEMPAKKRRRLSSTLNRQEPPVKDRRHGTCRLPSSGS